MSKLRVVIITGLSGAGRRSAAHTLEDYGWYIVDNLPPILLLSLCETAQQLGMTRLAVGLDVRSRDLFEQLPTVLAKLQTRGIEPEVLFLEADDAIIVQRQESVRRPLPLQGDGRLLDGIRKERRMLSTLRASADIVLDTSNLTVRQLAQRVAHTFGDDDADLRIAVMSFGFKHGLPMDADVVFDMRFLPNPHWIPELRAKTGLTADVSDYVLGRIGASEALDHYEQLLTIMAPGYAREGKRQVTIALGCTGGKHRSVAMTEALALRLRKHALKVATFHRDLGKE